MTPQMIVNFKDKAVDFAQAKNLIITIRDMCCWVILWS